MAIFFEAVELARIINEVAQEVDFEEESQTLTFAALAGTHIVRPVVTPLTPDQAEDPEIIETLKELECNMLVNPTESQIREIIPEGKIIVPKPPGFAQTIRNTLASINHLF